MAGWFDFVNGQTLPASRVQDYLMDQSVMVFADAAARTAALPSPTNGMMTYLTSPGELYVCTNLAWVKVIDNNNIASTPTRRNVVINGAFDFWQRGNTFSSSTIGQVLSTADRWLSQCTSAGTWTITASRQAFTPGDAPVAGYEGTFFYRHETSSGIVDGANIVRHRIEDVRTFANQTITVSYWAKANANITGYALPFIRQNFGTGGSANVDTTLSGQTYSTSWARYSSTITLPSISGKTVNANSYLELVITLPNNAASTFDLWGVQIEAGSVATPFVRAATTLQGELAACQRYYYRTSQLAAASQWYGMGLAVATSIVYSGINLPVTMRVIPTSLDFSGAAVSSSSTLFTGGTLSFVANSSNANFVTVSYTHTAATLTTNQAYLAGLAANGFVGFNAEL
jgi:hypothetical protein